MRCLKEFKDYQPILELERRANEGEFKRACRKLARTRHPGINKDPAAETRFKKISEATEVRADAEKPAAYAALRPAQTLADDGRILN